MVDDPEANDKVLRFLSDVVRNLGRGDKTLQFYATQALVVLTIEQLNIRIDTLKSIKHLLTPDQVKDIDTMIETYEGMKSKLYGEL